MPLKPEEALKLCKRRHPEWVEFQKQWRRLQDSLEGGVRYQQANYYYDPTESQRSAATAWPASYGFDPVTGQMIGMTYGQIVDRNLIPHLSEQSASGANVYTMRLERTPVPRMVERIVNQHLSKIYRQKIRRTGGKELTKWWENVDGTGTEVDKWLRKTIAPLFLVCGNLDIVFDLPSAPEDVPIESRADVLELGLNQPLASFILPENMLWWDLDLIGRYTECLVLERTCDTAEKNSYTNIYEPVDDGLCFRHYTTDEITLYDCDGEVVETRANAFSFVPIVRLFDTKKHRCKNVGQSRYEGIADLQRAMYNTRSEIILNDVFHSHPALSGPSNFIEVGGNIKAGPDGVLPKHVTPDGTEIKWEYVTPPQSCAVELSQHCVDYTDEADRLAAILKPAGHTTGKTVAQSGVSKQMDNVDANDLLSEIAETMADAERALALMIESVVARTRLNELDDTTEIVYPRDFKLDSADELTRILTDLQGLATAAGDLPEMTEEVFKKVYASLMTGIDDARLKELVKELQTFLAMKAQQAIEFAEAREVLALTGSDRPLVAETLNVQGQADASTGPVSVKPFDNSAPPNSNRSSLPTH